jgi:light-regulated signal transduction histidine kinase (bacteriophytochrome)
VNVTSALAIPLRANGRIIGAISLMRTSPGHPYTIDDRHLAQELADRAGLAIDKAVLVATLEQRVAERTAALAATNRELETFSYSVSHDLRTPLRAIDGFSRVLLADYGTALDATAQRYLSRICDATKRMSHLIDDLLNLARVTRQMPTFADLDLSALASEILTEIQLRDPARDVVVHIQPTVSAWADARMLRIVLENLLGNAWKFTSKHARAEIWFGADAKVFHVRDTGAGFDMAYAEKLFVPFQRLHANKDYDGTGVGLATVQRIIGLHGGRIWAEGELDKGATFRFTLGGHRPPGHG